MHIAGMIRHLAKETMQDSPPSDVDNRWIEQYVLGHRIDNGKTHKQFSYLPLPSIGHIHADQMIRRVMITATIGDDQWLKHVVTLLSGRQLKPERGNEFADQGPPTLIHVRRDKVAQHYTALANRWTSVTPAILPGHDDHRPVKTRKLIMTALAQAGIEQPCHFEWSATSRFRKSLSAHKFNRYGNLVYFKPRYLQELTAIHLTVTFDNEVKVPGPLAIGAGRHCGFGLMAPVDEN